MAAVSDLRYLVDRLAEAHGVELRIDHDDAAPMPFAIWAWKPECESAEDADIIGAGETETQALEEARRQLRVWEGRARS